MQKFENENFELNEDQEIEKEDIEEMEELTEEQEKDIEGGASAWQGYLEYDIELGHIAICDLNSSYMLYWSESLGGNFRAPEGKWINLTNSAAFLWRWADWRKKEITVKKRCYSGKMPGFALMLYAKGGQWLGQNSNYREVWEHRF